MAREAPRRRRRPRGAAILGSCATLALAGSRRCFVPPAERPMPAADPRAWAAAALVPAAGASAAGLAPPGVAPSGVNALPEGEQAAVFLAIFAGLAALSALLSGPLLGALRSALPQGWYGNWQKTWGIIGAFYIAAGVAHFTAAEPFEAIYPPTGTWGLWYLPGSAQFHVAWTGVAEILGGSGLFLGSLALGIAGALGQEPPRLLRMLPAAAALGLYVLTWCVTPANVYMYTHGAIMTGLTPGDQAIPVEIHAVRGAVQVVLLAFLWNFFESSWPSEEQSAEA